MCVCVCVCVCANSCKLVDYPAVAKLKYEITELLFEDFYLNANDIYKGINTSFESFKISQGEDLYRFATFDAL